MQIGVVRGAFKMIKLDKKQLEIVWHNMKSERDLQ